MQSEESRDGMRCEWGAVCLASPIWVNTHTSVDSQTKSRVSDFGIAFRGDGDPGTSPIVTSYNSRNPNPEGVVVSNPGVFRACRRNGMEWMDARSDGNGAMVWTRDTATGETRRGDEPHRTVPFYLRSV